MHCVVESVIAEENFEFVVIALANNFASVEVVVAAENGNAWSAWLNGRLQLGISIEIEVV